MDRFVADLGPILPRVQSYDLCDRLQNLAQVYWRTDIPRDPHPPLHDELLAIAQYVDETVFPSILKLAMDAVRGKYN